MKPTLAKFEEVADKCFGNITHIANAFNVNRKTVYEWIGNDKEFAEAIELGRDKIVDVAENAVVILAQGIPILDDKGKRVGWVTPPNPSSAHYILSTKGRKRGYGEHLDINTTVTPSHYPDSPQDASDYLEFLKAKYPEIDKLWFRMNGKPMIVGNADDPEMRPEVKDYFRIKAVQWPTDNKHSDGFPWIEFGTTLHTIGGYYKNSLQDESIMSVSVAQHCESCRFSASAWYGRKDHGRSWHNGRKDTGKDAVLKGYNFAEQWEYAIKLDPDIVFVTGFNEWTAMRLNEPGEPIAFIDNCDEEYSRDVEPSAGQLGDNYYMQMVKYIAKFKGTTAVLPKGGEKTIDIGGSFDQWNDDRITAVYKDYENDTFNRDCRGFGDTYYTDESGRNDIKNAKVAEDKENLYFYVDSVDALTAPAENGWMTLFINTSGQTGYDFCINRTAPENGKATVEAIRDDTYETKGKAELRFEGNQLMLSVPKALLGLGKKTAFTFKWADNYEEGSVMSFYTKGDSAPYGRLNWVYG